MYNIIWLEQTDSSNSEILRQLDNLNSFSVIAAKEQSKGRGQRGNKWLSASGENLTFSILIKFDKTDLKAENQFDISIISTIAMTRYLASKGIAAKIKWPNDIYVEDKKICGMLIENSLKQEYLVHSIIGIGLNLNQTDFNKELPNPCSLKQLTHNHYNIMSELELFMDYFISAYNTMTNRDYIRKIYHEYLYRKGEKKTYIRNSDKSNFYGIIEGIDDIGRLIVNINNNREIFGFKDISYVI